MPRSEIFFPPDAVKDYPPDYGPLEEAALHPLVSRVMDEDEELDGGSSPVNSPRFSRRGTRRELKKFRDSTSRRTPSRGAGSWSPDVTRPASVRSTTCESRHARHTRIPLTRTSLTRI